MNRVQAAAARWLGVDQQVQDDHDVLDEVMEAMESLSGSYALLERQLDDLLYIDVYSGDMAEKNAIIDDDKRLKVLTRVRRLRHENPIAKQAIKLTLRFTLGNGIEYLIKDDQLSTQFGEFWNDEDNQVVLTGHKALVRRFDETLTDGETFVAMATAQAAPYVKAATVPLEQIKEILYHPTNDEIPVWYKRVWFEREYDPEANDGQGGWKPLPAKPKVRYYRDWRVTDDKLKEIEEAGLTIPAAKQMVDEAGKPIYMKHRFVNPVRMKSGIRGLPEIFASRDWIYGYKNFMEARLAINAAAAAIAIHRKVKGGPAKVAALKSTLGGLKVEPESGSTASLSRYRSTPAPGSMLTTTDAEDLKGVKVDTGAPSAALDGNAILTAVVSGFGHPVHYLGSSNSALASTQSIEIAVVKGYEDWQTWFKDDLNELARFVFRQILGENSEVSAEDQQIAWSLPPIQGKDVVKYITANAQFAQQVAPKNRKAQLVAIRNSLSVLQVPNLEEVMAEIEKDQERVNSEADANAEMQRQAMANGGLPGAGGPPGGPPKPGDGKPAGGQKATTGPNVQASGPDDQRAVKGKGPRETTTGPRTSRQ